jgi:membrane protease YdiL (CAAX protease family)
MTDRHFEQPYRQMHPALQFLSFAGIFALVFIAANLLAVAITGAIYGFPAVMEIGGLNFTSPNTTKILWTLQIIGTTFPIFAAPVFFAYVIVKEPQDYIKPTFRFHWGLLLLIFAIMLISNPVIEFLSNLNQKMVLPPWLKWMREDEDKTQKIMDAMLQMKNIWQVIADVLVVGLLTAIVEEFMFRGVLQTIFVRWTKNIHVAVWITAILFSAFHIEFFGFLPRLLLGVLFGYFVAWSGSIWPAVWAHFLNNGTAVVATYLFQQKIIKMDPDNQHQFNHIAYLGSAVIMLLLLFIYRKIAIEKKQIPEY